MAAFPAQEWASQQARAAYDKGVVSGILEVIEAEHEQLTSEEKE